MYRTKNKYSSEYKGRSDFRSKGFHESEIMWEDRNIKTPEQSKEAFCWGMDRGLGREINLQKKSTFFLKKPICSLTTSYIYIVYSGHTHLFTHFYFPTKSPSFVVVVWALWTTRFTQDHLHGYVTEDNDFFSVHTTNSLLWPCSSSVKRKWSHGNCPQDIVNSECYNLKIKKSAQCLP